MKEKKGIQAGIKAEPDSGSTNSFNYNNWYFARRRKAK